MDTGQRFRKDIFLSAYSAGIGHLASAFSAVEIVQTLYLEKVMKYDAANPDWEGRDYFIMSKGHGSLALYAALADAGFFPRAELRKFCSPDGILGGEPHSLEVPGIEASTGSLGHGLSVAVGMALALKSDGKSNRVYVLLGDGECQEGSIWEAVISGAAFGLDNITVIIDNNRIQKMDFISEIIGSHDLAKQFAAFGWQVKTSNGHDVGALRSAIDGGWQAGSPRCVIAKTIKGKGLSLMEGNPAWHWRMPGKKELKVFMSELGITEEELEECRKHI
jgi:transketolase